MKKIYLQVAGFLDNSLVNGTGLRSVLFVSGCKHNCNGCHNKEIQSFCYGDRVSLDNILDRIKNNMPLIRGITFSGGEPFEHVDKLIILAKEIKKLNLNIWCYTGYTFEEILERSNEDNNWKEFISYIDVLVDGKFQEHKKDTSLKYRGSKNQRIIDMNKSLNCHKAVILSL